MSQKKGVAMHGEKLSLKGKRAVITGAAQGVGLSISEALAKAGAKVILIDIDETLLKTAQAPLIEKGFEVHTLALDVGDMEATSQVARYIEDEIGPVDILVNNTNMEIIDQPAEVMSSETWLNVMNVNLNGVFWCCQAFGKKMLRRGIGSIININSPPTNMGSCVEKHVSFRAAKAAVQHLSQALSDEWGWRGVRVNVVAPTYVDTEMDTYVCGREEKYRYWVGSKTTGQCNQEGEIASAVHFLASEASGFMTGSVVLTEGGACCE